MIKELEIDWTSRYVLNIYDISQPKVVQDEDGQVYVTGFKGGSQFRQVFVSGATFEACMDFLKQKCDRERQKLREEQLKEDEAAISEFKNTVAQLENPPQHLPWVKRVLARFGL